MIEAGWYHGEGDPVGTERYWDGSQWASEPVYERPAYPAAPTFGAPPPTAATRAPSSSRPPLSWENSWDGPGVPASPPPPEFPPGLKVLAIIVSVLKAIPLLFGFAATLLVIVAFGSANDSDEFDFLDTGGFDIAIWAGLTIFLIFFGLGALLLFFQLRGAIKGQPSMLLISAVIMAAIDLLLLLNFFASWRSDGPAANTVFAGIAVAQITTAIWAARARKAMRQHTRRFGTGQTLTSR